MKLLLTGGRGLLGTPLARRLAGSHEVVVTDLPELDVTDAAAVRESMERVQPHRVLHLAAWTDVDGCEREPDRAEAVNSQGTRNVAVACRDLGVGLLYVSTDYVFDGASSDPYTEADATAPLSAYGRSKLEGESAVRELASPWWIVRCQSIYGRGRKSFADAILARAAAGDPLRVVTDQVVHPSFADDLAEAVAAVLLRGSPGLYLVANSGSCTWFDFARAVLDEAGYEDVAITRILAADLGRAAPRPANSRFDCSRLEEATGTRLRSWRAALHEYLQPVSTAGESA